MALKKVNVKFSFPAISHLDVVLRDLKQGINSAVDHFLGWDIGNLRLYDTDQSDLLDIKWNEAESNPYTLNLKVNSGNRTIDLTGNLTISTNITLDQQVHTTASPTFYSPLVTEVRLKDTVGDRYLTLQSNEDLGVNRDLNFVVGDATRAITLSGNPTLADWFDQSVKAAASPTFNDLKTTDNIGVGISAWGTSAAKVLGLGGSTAPTTSPADMIQLYSADRSAGYAQLHYRAEGGEPRPLDPTHNVHDYGAKGDGSTNDSTAIQAAVDQSGAGGSITLLGGKTYIIGTGITISNNYASFNSVGGTAILSMSTDIDAITLSALHITLKNIHVVKTGAASTKAGIKLADGSKVCYIENCFAQSFKWGMELVSVAAGAGVYYNTISNFWTNSSIEYDVKIHDNSGHVNENTFMGGSLHGGASTGCVYMEGNQNKFMGTSFEAWYSTDEYGFAVVDMGQNFVEGCRFETASGKIGYGIYAENSSANFANSPRYTNNFWGCSYPLIALYAGRVRVQDADFVGGIEVSGNRVATTVDVTSAAGQKVLSVASTTGMYVGDVALVDDEEDGGGKEWVYIASISAGVSITGLHNLRYEHTSGDADTVVIKERKHGFDIERMSLNADSFYWTLPTADGNVNEAWGTDGSGALIWRTHDELAGFVGNEHIDWTSSSSAFSTSGGGVFSGSTIPLRVKNDGDTALYIQAYDDAEQSNATIKMLTARGTEASSTVVAENDVTGEWTSFGYDGTNFIRTARIYMDVDGTPGTNDMPGRIDFEVTPDGGVTPILAMRINNTGNVLIGDTANAKMTRGLTINQLSADDEILALKSSDVAHGITGRAETDTYATFSKRIALTGGVAFWGFSEADVAIQLYGAATDNDTNKDASATAPITFWSALKSDTNVGAMGANANIFVVQEYGQARFIVDEDGDILYDGTAGAYQDHDDIELLAELEVNLDKSKKLKSNNKYNKKDLEDAKLIRPFLSTKRLNMLQMGAFRQMNKKIEALEQEIRLLKI